MEDPVCKMDIDKSSKFKSVYSGKTYHFCSKACKDRFDKSPSGYVK